MFLAMGVIAFLAELNMVGAILLVGIGIVGVAGALKGSFEDKEPD